MNTDPLIKLDRMRNLLAFMLIGAFISCIPMFVFKLIPEANNDIITYMVGQLSGMALTALGWYFVNKAGQDASDARKSDNTGKLADAMRAQADATVATAAAAAAAATTGPEVATGKPGDPVHTQEEP